MVSKTKKPKLDIPCKCGHSMSAHIYKGALVKKPVLCWDNEPSNKLLFCSCDQYQPDNLSWVEALAKERKLI